MKRSFRWFFCTLLSCALLLGMLGSSEVLAAENLSGSCGQNLVWSFEPETGTLTIAGEGAIQDYESAERTPWAAHSAEIRSIVLLPGVTAIGKNAFAGCGVEKVVFPETLEIVGQNAFRGCRSLSELDLSGTRVRHIAAGAFVGCAKLTAEKVKLPQTIEYVDAAAFVESAEKDVAGSQVDQPAETEKPKQEETAQQPGAAAKNEETPAEEPAEKPVRTWMEEQDGSILQLREMSDGTVQVDCYEDGELVYTSTRTYGEGGRVHEKKEYSDGDTVVEDRVEDEGGNVLSSEAEYYEDGKLKYTQSTTYGEDGSAHAEIRYPDGSYSVKDWVEGPDGKTLSLEQTVYDPDGNQVNRVVSRTEGDKSFLFVYDKGNNLFVEVERTEKPDGGYREIRKDYLPGTQKLDSTMEIVVRLDANGEEIERSVVATSGDGTFHQETVCKRNEDGTYTETSTVNRDGEVSTSIIELDKNREYISSSSQTVDADGRVTAEEEEIFHEDGSSTRTGWSLDSENKKTQVTEVRSATGSRVSSADTIWNEKGELIGGKDGFRLPDGNWWETQAQKNQDGSQTIFEVIRDEHGSPKEQTEWRTGEKVIHETLMRLDAEGVPDWVRTTTLEFSYDEEEEKWSYGHIAILDEHGNLLEASNGTVNEDGSMTVTIETDNGDGRTKRITYTLVRDEVAGEIRTDAVTSILDGNGTAVETTRVTQNADGSFTRAVDNGILTEEFVYKDGTKLSHTRTIKATGECRETTFDENGDPHTEVYDKNHNLTDQVNTLSLNEPMAVAMWPVAEEPIAEEPVAEEPIAEEPIAEEPIAEDPIAEEPIAEEPVAEEPVAEEPVAEELIAEEPVAEEDPAAEEPQTESEASELPAEDEPAAVPAA